MSARLGVEGWHTVHVADWRTDRDLNLELLCLVLQHKVAMGGRMLSEREVPVSLYISWKSALRDRAEVPAPNSVTLLPGTVRSRPG